MTAAAASLTPGTDNACRKDMSTHRSWILASSSTPSARARAAPRASEAHKLLSPAEMGEIFKVLAVGRGVPRPLLGFADGERSHTL